MRKVVVLLLVCVFLGTLAACNNNGKMNSPTEANSVTVTNSTIDIGEKTPDGKYSSLDTFVKADAVAEVLGNFSGSSNIDVDCYAEGDTLVYCFTYKNTYDDAKISEMKENLTRDLDSDAAPYGDTAKMLSSYVNVTNPAVKVIYRNGDGTIIIEKTYYPN